MSLVLILTLLCGAVGLGALLALAWLWRGVRWELLDDDELHDRIAHDRMSGGNWLRRWLKPKPPMLTYGRDRLGRFRRYRR